MHDGCSRLRDAPHHGVLEQGAVEVSAQLPGESSQPGLWPAFWLMGNLGRATFERSTAGLWPFIFDECVEPNDEAGSEHRMHVIEDRWHW